MSKSSERSGPSSKTTPSAATTYVTRVSANKDLGLKSSTAIVDGTKASEQKDRRGSFPPPAKSTGLGTSGMVATHVQSWEGKQSAESTRTSSQLRGPRESPSPIQHASSAVYLSTTTQEQPRRSSMPEAIRLETLRKEAESKCSFRQRQGNFSPSTVSEKYEEAYSPSETSHSSSKGFYFPPPGFNDSQPAFQGYAQRHPSPRYVPILTDAKSKESYGGAGTWHRLSDGGWTWIPPGHTALETKNAASKWVEENILPALSHNDWSIPQAKQILASWATLATLLAGTQATLLTYYKETDDSFYSPLVHGLSCAALCLEVYGALMASLTIVASIGLQAPSNSGSSSVGLGGQRKTDDGALGGSGFAMEGNGNALGPLGHPNFNAARQGPFANDQREGGKKPLSPRATAILDRMTVAAGIIIPIGAILEICGLAAYSFQFQQKGVSVAIGITLGGCVSITLLGALLGWKIGGERERMIQEIKTLQDAKRDFQQEKRRAEAPILERPNVPKRFRNRPRNFGADIGEPGISSPPFLRRRADVPGQKEPNRSWRPSGVSGHRFVPLSNADDDDDEAIGLLRTT